MYVAPADQRILAGSAATLEFTLLDQHGEPDATGTVTVGVTRGDGTVLIAAGTATTTVGTLRTLALTRAQTEPLDRLTATWAIGSDTVGSTVIDVVGRHWFPLPALRSRQGLAGIEARDLIAARDGFSDLADRVTGVAWVPRWWTESFEHRGGNIIVPAWPKVRRLISVTVDGTAQTLTDWRFDADGGVIIAPAGIGCDITVTLVYEHGYDGPPEPLVKAALRAAEWSLLGDTSNVSPRTMSFSNDAGSFRYAVASEKYPTGLPEVDAVLATYDHRLPGIA
jgi:hypothetical protein